MPETPAHAAPPLSVLVPKPGEPGPLSPAQQRLNGWMARIDTLSGHIQRLEDWSQRHRYAHIQALQASVQQAQAHRKSLMLLLHERLQTADLTDRQQHMARGLLRGLIAHGSATADPQVQALADVYVNAEDTLEAAQAQAEAAQRLRERIEQALGQPIEKPGQYQTPEAMMAAGMRQWQRQHEADEQRKAAKRAARKAQKQARKSSQAAEKGAVLPAMLREADAKSAIRTVFRQLASAWHPDREPEGPERLRKTALMSEANAAYEKNDLRTLLRLQLQLAQVQPSGQARLADAQLDAMSGLLKAQVATLEDELDRLEARLSRELCVPVSAQAAEATLTQALQRVQADQRHTADSLAADLRLIQNDAELKRWLKAQWQLAKATSA